MDAGASHGAKKEFSHLFNPVYLLDDKTFTWRRGHSCHWYVRKRPHRGEWIYGATWKCLLPFMFFVHLFVCLFSNIFTFLYLQQRVICVSNNKILKFNLFYFNVCSNVVTCFVVNGIFRGNHSRVFLKIVIHFRYTWGISVGGSFLVKLHAACLLFSWKWAPTWIFLKYFA